MKHLSIQSFRQSSLIITMLMIVLCLLLWYILKRWLKYRDGNIVKPPIMPGAIPLIGHAHLYVKKEHMYDFIKNASEFCLKNDGVIRLQMGPIEAYAIGDPNDCFTVANSCLNKNYAYDFFKEWVGAGLLCVRQEDWKHSRKQLLPAFSFTVLNQYISIFNSESRKLVQTLTPLAKKGFVNIDKFLTQHNLEVTFNTTLQIKSSDEEDKLTFLNTSTEIMDAIGYRMQKLWMALDFLYKLTSNYWQFRKLIKINKCIANKIIAKRKAELQKEDTYSSETTNEFDKFKPLLDLLLKLSAERPDFPEKKLVEHISTFIVGNYDTTMTALSAFLVLVGTYTNVQEKIIKEIQTQFGDSKRDIVKEDLYNLVYLDAVIKETLRLYPVAPVITRVTDKEVKLKNYTLPAGTNVGLLLYAVNRHSSWGADANEFRPERWLEPGGIPDNPNAFASFSMGKRDCIGKRYAILVMKITLIYILREFKITSDINRAKFYLNPLLKFSAGQELKLDLR